MFEILNQVIHKRLSSLATGKVKLWSQNTIMVSIWPGPIKIKSTLAKKDGKTIISLSGLMRQK